MCCGVGILGSIACCFGSAACSLCCKCCPSCKNSTSSRIVYAFFLLLGVILSCILLIPGVRHAFDKIPSLCKGIAENQNIIDRPGVTDGFVNCDLIFGYRAVYSVGFGMVCFFAFMAALMICVKSSKDPRASVQNGFWFFKGIAFVGPMVGGFFLPWDKMAEPWMIIGMIGAFVFILIQLVLIVDLAHSWNDKLLEKAEDSGNKGWYIAMLCLTIIFFIIALTGMSLMFYFYGHPAADGLTEGCGRHKAFLGVNLAVVVVVSIIAVLPKIQAANPRSGLLQPSIIALYITYLTWSAITNDTSCNPSFTEVFERIKGSNVTVQTNSSQWGQQLDGLNVLTLIVWFAAIIYATVRNSSHSSVGKLTMKQDEKVIIGDTDDAESGKNATDDDDKKVWDDEKDAVAYNYTFLHLMFMFAAFYVMMTLTNWYKPSVDSEGIIVLNRSVPAMWVKIASSWVCVLIYLWTLLAPLILAGRDFS